MRSQPAGSMRPWVALDFARLSLFASLAVGADATSSTYRIDEAARGREFLGYGVNPSAGHLAGAGDGEERDNEGCRVASVPAFGGVERAGDGARGVRACGRVRPEEGERRRRGGAS